MYRRSDAADMQARQERSFGGLFLFRYIPSFGATIPLVVFIVSRGESAGYRSGEISAALRVRGVDRYNFISQASCTRNKMYRSQLRYAQGTAQFQLSLLPQ